MYNSLSLSTSTEDPSFIIMQCGAWIVAGQQDAFFHDEFLEIDKSGVLWPAACAFPSTSLLARQVPYGKPSFRKQLKVITNQ
jgi:hypothetical protein